LKKGGETFFLSLNFLFKKS
jgi:hypothetical protein